MKCIYLLTQQPEGQFKNGRNYARHTCATPDESTKMAKR